MTIAILFLSIKNSVFQFLLLSLVPAFFVWRLADFYFKKRGKRWLDSAEKTAAENHVLREEQAVLKEKLTEAHADIEAKTMKIARLSEK